MVHAVRVSDVPAVPDGFPYRFEIKRTRKVVVFSGDRHPTHSSADEEFLALARGAMCLSMSPFLSSALEQLLPAVYPEVRAVFRQTITGIYRDVSQQPRIARLRM